VHTSAGFEGEVPKVRTLAERRIGGTRFVGRYSGGGRLGRSSHCSNSDQISGL